MFRIAIGLIGLACLAVGCLLAARALWRARRHKARRKPQRARNPLNTVLADDRTCRGVPAPFDELTSVQSKNVELRRLLRRLRWSQKKIRSQKRALTLAKVAAETANQAKS